jgi:hypothetical protein
LPFALLLGALLVFGCYPKLLTDQIGPVVVRIVDQMDAGTRPAVSAAARATPFIPAPASSPASRAVTP